MFIFSEIATASVRFVPPNDHYYQGEDAYIKAYFENYSAVCFVKWQRETDGGSHPIDTTLPKYEGTIDSFLMIRGCDESDEGTYFIKVRVPCIDWDICSNKLHLQVLKGKIVTFHITQLILRIISFVNHNNKIHFTYTECSTEDYFVIQDKGYSVVSRSYPKFTTFSSDLFFLNKVFSAD